MVFQIDTFIYFHVVGGRSVGFSYSSDKESGTGAGKSYTTVEEFASAVDCAQVVGVTCLGISHALFSKRKFDVCIVDEAGQITLPVMCRTSKPFPLII